MTSLVRSSKPKFPPYSTWGACSRCGARVRYDSLERERLTGLLVCGPRSGRPVRYCLDPWPEVYDFQAYPDRSIEPPPEPLPARWNLDNIWGNGPASGTTKTFAAAPQAAPDDATRLVALLRAPPYYAQLGKSAAFVAPNPPAAQKLAELTVIVPANYDGTFLPSTSVRTVVPPDEGAELANLSKTDVDVPTDKNTSLPWAAVQKV